MTKLKVKASSKPKSKQQEKDPWSKSKPTTSYGRFSSRWLEGSGLAPSTTMAGLAALGVGGLFPAVSHFAPALRSLLEYRIGGGKDKSGSSRAGEKVDAVSVSRAANATQGINTLTKITKKGFADVLKAMGASPKDQKKKKSIWSMLGDALTGAAGAAGGFRLSNLLPAALLGNRTVGGLLLRTLALGVTSHYLANQVRGHGSQFTGGNIAYAIGDTIIGNRTVNAGKTAYKTYTAGRIAQNNARMAKIVAGGHNILSSGRTVKNAVRLTTAGIRTAGLATAAATSVYTFGLSLLVEEAIMKGIVEPLIHRYVRNQVRTEELPVYHRLKGGSFTRGDLHKSASLIRNTGGTYNWMERGWDYTSDYVDWWLASAKWKTSPTDPKLMTPQQLAKENEIKTNLANAQSATEKGIYAQQLDDFYRETRKGNLAYKSRHDNLSKKQWVEARKSGKLGLTTSQALYEGLGYDDSYVYNAIKEDKELSADLRKKVTAVRRHEINAEWEKAGHSIYTQRGMLELMENSKKHHATNADMENVGWYVAQSNTDRANPASAATDSAFWAFGEWMANPNDETWNKYLKVVDEGAKKAGMPREEIMKNVYQIYRPRARTHSLAQVLPEKAAKKIKESVEFTNYSRVVPNDFSSNTRSDLFVNPETHAPTILQTPVPDNLFYAGKTDESAEKIVQEAVQAKNNMESDLSKASEDATYIHKETLSLIEIQNQLDGHLVEVAGLLSGKKVESIGLSGNEKEAPNGFDLMSTDTGPATSTSFDGLFKKLQDLNEITMTNPRR